MAAMVGRERRRNECSQTALRCGASAAARAGRQGCGKWQCHVLAMPATDPAGRARGISVTRMCQAPRLAESTAVLNMRRARTPVEVGHAKGFGATRRCHRHDVRSQRRPLLGFSTRVPKAREHSMIRYARILKSVVLQRDSAGSKLVEGPDRGTLKDMTSFF